MLSPVLGFIHSFQSTCYNTFTRRMSNGAKQGVAPVARAPPLFLPRPELKYIYVLHTSAPPRTYLVRATLLLSPNWRHWTTCSLFYFFGLERY